MPRILLGTGLSLLLALLPSGCSRDPVEKETVERAPSDPVPAPSRVTGTSPKPTGGFGSIVVLERETPVETPAAAAPPPPAEAAVMDQAGNAFHPKVLLVRLGQPVEFRNSEDVLHNVHVVDAETRRTVFNVATPVVGSYRHTFESEGAYDVSCEIHPSMAAFVFVTSSPYAAVADGEGRFEIPRVPIGRYLARVWNLDPKRRGTRPVEVGEGVTELTLTLDPS
jgi:plastocyanin